MKTEEQIAEMRNWIIKGQSRGGWSYLCIRQRVSGSIKVMPSIYLCVTYVAEREALIFGFEAL